MGKQINISMGGKINATRTCSKCRGHGEKHGETCSKCNGKGVITEKLGY